MATENTNVVDGKIVYTPGTHWTQTPEGRERLSRMTRERAAKRGLVPKGPGKHWECTTCKVQCNDKYYHERMNPGHVIQAIGSKPSKKIVSVLGNESSILRNLLDQFSKDELIDQIIKGAK